MQRVFYGSSHDRPPDYLLVHPVWGSTTEPRVADEALPCPYSCTFPVIRGVDHCREADATTWERGTSPVADSGNVHPGCWHPLLNVWLCSSCHALDQRGRPCDRRAKWTSAPSVSSMPAVPRAKNAVTQVYGALTSDSRTVELLRPKLVDPGLPVSLSSILNDRLPLCPFRPFNVPRRPSLHGRAIRIL